MKVILSNANITIIVVKIIDISNMDKRGKKIHVFDFHQSYTF